MLKTTLTTLALAGTLACSFTSPPSEEGLGRERNGETAAAKDALEGRPPPALAVSDWQNRPDEPLDWSQLKGKVVVIDFWGTW